MWQVSFHQSGLGQWNLYTIWFIHHSSFTRWLTQYNEFQELVKEKERLYYNHLKQQKNNRLNEGFKIKVSNSQIFDDPMIESSIKDDVDNSSARSSGRMTSHFKSPEKLHEFQKALGELDVADNNPSAFKKKKSVMKKVEFSEMQPTVHQL